MHEQKYFEWLRIASERARFLMLRFNQRKTIAANLFVQVKIIPTLKLGGSDQKVHQIWFPGNQQLLRKINQSQARPSR